MQIGVGGENFGQRGFPASGRPPEDQARQMPAFDHFHQRAALADQMILPDDVFQRFGAQTIGQRAALIRRRVQAFVCVYRKKIGHFVLAFINRSSGYDIFDGLLFARFGFLRCLL